MRRIRYKDIADELRQRFRDAPVGSVLPSESDMSAEFEVSRVTIRRALELVREDGLIAARQGFGWYVAGEPVRQSLESLGTIESQVEGVGKISERKVEEFAFVQPPARVRALLQTDQVLRVKRVNLADGEPFAVVTVWCPADLGANLSRRDVEQFPFYELIDVELRGATQTIGADAADAAISKLLNIPVGAPLLRCQRVTTDREGHPVLVSEHLFSAHRTEFVVELPQAGPSLTPSGLRLVD
ncbi:GntR family transcriptional regulator [Ilumatobacter coccineus]|uniref:Putative GntR family transcriptional regulator n=1 Tax=Ilumatobacter coccineus (strain NBRC 103263 / KCTC 29153 / YM16-304) TaxID=1313172 RepID=A0A6C7E4H5_ILUCY|nr:GntR family transcriptional regulator [Ilumatobacter coccineus]BAN02754.1 putative GntR family transcriptional regulator [Ilumatobacter coccineus YM16-304]